MEKCGFLCRIIAHEPVTKGGDVLGELSKLKTLLPTSRKGTQSEEGRGTNLRSDLVWVTGKDGVCPLAFSLSQKGRKSRCPSRDKTEDGQWPGHLLGSHIRILCT